jgi:hypothetical protein
MSTEPALSTAARADRSADNEIDSPALIAAAVPRASAPRACLSRGHLAHPPSYERRSAHDADRWLAHHTRRSVSRTRQGGLPRRLLPRTLTLLEGAYCWARMAATSATGSRTTGPVAETSARMILPLNGKGAS